MRSAAVLPARLGTLFSSPAALERFCAIHRGTITSFLAATEAQEEWAFKVLLDRAKASDWLVSRLADGQQGAATAGLGTRYLQERRLRAAAAAEINHWVAQTLEPLVDELGRYASASRQRGVTAQAAAAEPQPLLNLAFLVHRESAADFQRCVERAGASAPGGTVSQLTLTGPWPPYSFCPALEMPP